MGVIEERTFVDADVGRGEIALQPLDNVPLEVEPGAIGRFDDVQFFAGTFANIRQENTAADRIARHAMRAAEADGIEFFEGVGLAHKRIIVRNVVI